MPARREDGSAVVPKRRRRRSSSTSSGGHPSRGGTTVGGGTGGRRPERYRSPTPAAPKTSPTPYEQLRDAGELDKQGRQKHAGRRRRRSERGRLVPHFKHTEDGWELDSIDVVPLEQFLRDQRRARRLRESVEGTQYADDRLSPMDPRLRDTKALGLNLDAFAADLDRRWFPESAPGLRLAKVPFEVGKATVEDPAGVAKGTARGLKDTLVGIPSAAVKAVTDPEEAVEQIFADYRRRYGPLLEGDERAFRERIKREGFTAEALDVGGAASVGGRLAGIARRVVREPAPRPRLRTSGGPSRPQQVSRNALVETIQRAHDRARRGVTDRRVQRAEQTGGRVDALDASLELGEVAPIRRRRRQRVEPAKRKARAHQAMKAEQGHEVRRGANRNLSQLNKHERAGFKYAMQIGIRDPETALRALGRRREQIVAAREAEGTRIPKALRKTNDELRVIDEILAAPERVFTARLARVADEERARSERLGAGDPSLDDTQRLLRRHMPVAEHLGVARREGESADAFAARVMRVAADEGLTDPAYFPSRKRPTIRYSDYAVGGTRAVAEDKRYTGALFRTGREDTRPEAYVDALARNIKRRHNWGAVADNFDAHSFGWGRNGTIGQLLDELDRRGIDPGSVAFWNPRKYRAAREEIEDHDFVEEAAGDDVVPPGLAEAVDEAAVDVKSAQLRGAEFRNTSGWTVVPKAVYDEIHADTRPSGAAARSWDVLKGKQSRILLGTNPPWLAFQAASNALLAGLARTGPIDAVKAQAWWRKLDPELRAEVEPYVGVGPFAVDVQQTKLGASTNNRLINSYRAFKQTPMLQQVGKANPLDVLFRVDNAQNNAFRRSVLYSQAKRHAYRRLGQDVGRVAAAQQRLQGLFTLGPMEQIERVIRDREALEQHADYVNQMLGDYATYTARERRTLARGIMFYGFLRHSLHFTFWTMPTKHPVTSAIVGNLARLEAQEVRELLGGDDLPFALGRLYLTKDGKLQAVDLGRANPATNALTELVAPYDGGVQFVPRKALGLVAPMVGAAFDLAYGKSAFTNRPLRVRGEHTYAAMEREQSGREIGLEDRGRIALERMLRLAFPYRAAETVAFEGQPQGDDSLLWDQRPTEYKDPEIRRSLAGERRRQRQRGPVGVLVEEMAPFLPHPTRDPEIARNRRRRDGGGKRRRKRGSLLDSDGGSGGKSLLDGTSSGGRSLLD